MKRNQSTSTILIVVILILLGVAGYAYLAKAPTPPDATNNSNVSPVNNSNSEAEDPFGLDKKNPDTKVYISDALGIGFTYNPTGTANNVIQITEDANTIYVHGREQEPAQGQWIEVFTKDSTTSFEQTLQNQFLSDLRPADCYIKIYDANDMSLPHYVAAGISADPLPNSDGPWWERAEQCNPDYAETNGVRYFLMNNTVPNKFIFVSIGQDSITSDGTPINDSSTFNWSHSIRIIN